MHAPVLVLNASYEPINICAARRAIVLVLKGVAITEEINGHLLHSARIAVRVPSVIRLAGVSPHSPPDARPFAQEHPVARSQHLPVLRRLAASSELTLDHIVPRSRGWPVDLGELGRLLPSV